MAITVGTERINRNSSQSVYFEDGSRISVETNHDVYITTEAPVDDDSVEVEINFDLYKAREEEGLVSGWASVSVNADGSIPMDWQDDIIAPATLEKAAIDFMLTYRESGVMHDNGPVGTVVESIVFTKEKQEAIGIPAGAIPEGWFITVKIHDAEVFAKVKDGTYKMFSIQGSSKRVKL